MLYRACRASMPNIVAVMTEKGFWVTLEQSRNKET